MNPDKSRAADARPSDPSLAKEKFEMFFADALVALADRQGLDLWETDALDRALDLAERGEYETASGAVRQALVQRGERQHMDGSLAPSNIRLDYFEGRFLTLRNVAPAARAARH